MSSKHQAIAKIAYLLWESRGRPENTAQHDWAEAEVLLAGADSQPEAAAAELPTGGELGVSDILPSESTPAAPFATRRKTDGKSKIAARRVSRRSTDKGSSPN